jgi:hypothetical protein
MIYLITPNGDTHELTDTGMYFEEEDAVWRVNYGPKDYVSRRGGDFIVDVDARDASVKQVLHGQ